MPAFTLRTLGGLALLKDGKPVEGPSAQRKRLILLALVAAHNQGSGVSRDRVLGLLWPESDEARARNALNQSLFALRRDLGGDALTGVSDLRLDATLLECDLVEFWRANERGDAAGVVARYAGPFLDGVYVAGAGDLNAWIERTRSAVDNMFRSTLQSLARRADADGTPSAAVALWRRLASVAPLDASIACSLMRALVANEDRTGAVAHARAYGTLVRTELEVEPDASVTSLAAQLVQGSPTLRARPTGAFHAAIPSNDTVPTRPPVPRHFVTYRARLVAGIAIASAIVVYGGMRVSQKGFAAAAARSQMRDPVVFPFQVDIADSSLTFLGEGIADLLAAALAQQGGAVPADAHSLAIAWKMASAESGDRAAIAVRAIQRVGATRAILGTVVGNRSQINVSAQIIGDSGRIIGAIAQASGSPDSILAIVDRLASSLLAGQATQDAARLADLTTRSPTALRHYLHALSAMRSGNRDSAVTAFRAAMHSDTSFALAALGIATAGGWAEASVAERLKHDFRLGWKLRLQLPPQERSLFDAAVGLYDPTEDSDAANLDRWAQAARVAPDHADVMYEYGDRLFHTGAYLGIANADGLAERAFALAVRVDSGQIVALGHLSELALYRGDVAQAEAYYRAYMVRDTLADAAAYLGWRIAHVMGDSTATRSLRAHFDQLPSSGLRRIAGVSQLDGVSVADANHALTVLMAREQGEREHELTQHRVHAFDLNIGKAAAAARVLDALDAAAGDPAAGATLGDALDLAITDALFSVGDKARARRAEARIEAGHDSRTATTSLRHACSAELWRTEHGDTTRTTRTLRMLSEQRSTVDSVGFYGWQPGICISGLTAELSIARHAGNARDAVARMDALMAAGPRGFGSAFGNIWVAQMYVRVDDVSRALVAVSRRRRNWDDVLYLSDMDALALRLARAAGTPGMGSRAETRLQVLRRGGPG